MKKIILMSMFLGFTLMGSIGVSGYAVKELEAAKKMAELGVIVDHGENITEYKLDSSITRREMVKIMSFGQASTSCEGIFGDMNGDDWGCKYAEYVLSKGIITQNANFRPNDSITQIEALKMASKLYDIDKDPEESDWRAGYVSAGKSRGILRDVYFDYDMIATRGWIFNLMNQTTITPGLQEGEIIRIVYSLMGARDTTTILESGRILVSSDLDETENMDINILTEDLSQITNAMNNLSRIPRIFVPDPMIVYDGGFHIYLVYEDELVHHTTTDDELAAFLELIDTIKDKY